MRGCSFEHLKMNKCQKIVWLHVSVILHTLVTCSRAVFFIELFLFIFFVKYFYVSYLLYMIQTMLQMKNTQVSLNRYIFMAIITTSANVQMANNYSPWKR